MVMPDKETDEIIKHDYDLQCDRREKPEALKRWIVLGGFFFLLNVCFIIVMCLNHAIVGHDDAVVMLQGAETDSEYLEGNDETDLESATLDKEELSLEGEEDADESDTYNELDNAGKRVYLTFDDGPSKNTEKILDILKKYNVKATFFVVGRDDEFSKEMYQRIVKEGHTLGMHSYSHDYSEIYKTRKAFLKDLHKIENLLYEATGEKPIFYRFPGGTSNTVSKVPMKTLIRSLTKRGMVYYDWNAMSGDASGKDLTKKQMMNNVLKDVENFNTSVVLLHDGAGKDKTVDMLPGLIKKLQKRDIAILPISENTPLVQHRKAES